MMKIVNVEDDDDEDRERERGHWTPDWAGRGQDRPGEAQISGFKFGDVVVVSDKIIKTFQIYERIFVSFLFQTLNKNRK